MAKNPRTTLAEAILRLESARLALAVALAAPHVTAGERNKLRADHAKAQALLRRAQGDVDAATGRRPEPPV